MVGIRGVAMPLRRKLLLTMTIPGLLLMAVGGAGMFAVLRLERAAEDILSDNYRTIQEARRLERLLRTLEESQPGREMPIGGGDRGALSASLDAALTECERNITVEGEHRILERLRAAWDERGAALLADVDQGELAVRDPVRRTTLMAPLFAGVDELVAVNERAMFSFERRERRVAHLMFGIVAVTSSVALLALLLFAAGAATRVSRPVLAVAERLHRALEDPGGGPESAVRGDELQRLTLEVDDLLERLENYEREQVRRLDRLRDRFAFVMEEVREGFVLLDDDKNIVSLNRIGRALLGLAPGEGEGRNLETLPLGDELESVLRPLLDLRPPPPGDSGEITVTLDAGERLYRPRVLPIAPDATSPGGLLLILWDVTEERRFEEARRKFIAMLSHQLKTPVTSLTMSVSLLWEKLRDADDDSSDLLAMAREDCALLSSSLSELIDAARDAARDISLIRRRTELTRLLRRAVTPLVAQAEEKGIRFHDRLGPGGAFAEVDPVKFPWVVTNILGNALRYTPKGGSVTIELRPSDTFLSISVADTGVGIAPHDLKRLFLPFLSLDAEPDTQSLGLGLTIAKEIVEAHGGEIEVDSEPGKGTTFTIRVPTAPGEAP
jgi:NtrC-family two-component system sensor histidine kinase KinB